MTTAKSHFRASAAIGLLLGCGGSGSSSGDGATDAGTDGGIACAPEANVREEIPDSQAFRPRIAVDELGGVHVVYEHLDAAYYAHRPPGGGTWSTETVVDPNVNGVDVAIEGDGTVHVVGGASSSQLVHAVRSLGGDWQYEYVDTSSMSLPAAAVSADGTLYACGSSFSGSLGCARRSSSGAWDVDVVDIGGSGVIGFKDMAVDAQGGGHVLFAAYSVGMRIGHAWTAANAGTWEAEWVTEARDSHADMLSLSVDAAGALTGAYTDRIDTDSTPRTFGQWWATARYIRKAPGEDWTVEPLLADAVDPSVVLLRDRVGVVLSPRVPYSAAHAALLATRVGEAWRRETYGCGVIDFLQAVGDGCCVHSIYRSASLELVYERYCPTEEPTLDLVSGTCLASCQAEVAACEKAWCDWDSDPVSTCERLAMNLFTTCTTYDVSDPSCVGPGVATCPGSEIQDAWGSLQECVRERCYVPCP